MKKSGKIILGLAGLAALAWLGYKSFKKEQKKILEANAEDEQQLRDLGLDPKYVEDQLVPEEDDHNLVKPLFMAAYGGCDFETSSVEPSECLFNDSDDPIVFIMQSSRKLKKEGETIHNLDIHLEIPDFNDKFHKMRDFILGGKELAKHLWCDVIKYIEEPYTSLCGFMVLELQETENGPYEQRVFKIPEFLYQNSKFTEGSKSNGLEEFVKGWINEDEETLSELEKIPAWLAEIFPDKTFLNIRPNRAFMTYKISFNIAEPSETPGLNKCGIDVKSGIAALKYIVNEFSVVSSKWDYKKYRVAPKIQWKKLVFNAPNPSDGRWNFLRYYDKNEEGDVIDDTYEW